MKLNGWCSTCLKPFRECECNERRRLMKRIIEDVEKLLEVAKNKYDPLTYTHIRKLIDSLAVEVESAPTPINDVYMCCVCGNTPVDVASGFDTCGNCARNI